MLMFSRNSAAPASNGGSTSNGLLRRGRNGHNGGHCEVHSAGVSPHHHNSHGHRSNSAKLQSAVSRNSYYDVDHSSRVHSPRGISLVTAPSTSNGSVAYTTTTTTNGKSEKVNLNGDNESGLLKRGSGQRSTLKKSRPHSWHSTLQRGFHRARSRSSGRGDQRERDRQQHHQHGRNGSVTRRNGKP